MALRVNISGQVIAVIPRTTKSANGKDGKPFREVHLLQRDEDGTPQKYKVKVWDATFEVNEGQDMRLPCTVRSWGMKTDAGDYKHGLDITVVDQNR